MTDSVWEYIELWLRRCPKKESSSALLYWNQARHFYNASLLLPNNAKPLTIYYCFLNLAKSLLVIEGISTSKLSQHGISSDRKKSRNLKDFNVNIRGAGVLAELAQYFKDETVRNKYTIDEILYNIPYIHRAYIHTYTKNMELFIPISEPIYVKKSENSDAWLQFEVKGRFRSLNSLKNLPNAFEPDLSHDDYVFRTKKRFAWDIHLDIDSRFESLIKYQDKYRNYFYYIIGDETLWYVKKKSIQNKRITDRSSITLTFAAMHWLSELVRYEPEIFEGLMSTKQNWLISEFISLSLDQFIYSIASEISGQSVMKTRVRT